MSNIICNIVVAIFGLLISPFMVALIKRFSSEEKIFDKTLKEDMKFDAKIAFITPIILIILLFFLRNFRKIFHIFFY